MNTTALITMILAQGIVTCIAAYFLYRVLTTPQKPDTDPGDEENARDGE